MTPQPTPRGTDMANLSERLRGPAKRRRVFLTDIEVMNEAADLIDRLTVEGLAGVIFEALPDRSAWDAAERREINAEDDRTAKDIASKLLTYITGETHD